MWVLTVIGGIVVLMFLFRLAIAFGIRAIDKVALDQFKGEAEAHANEPPLKLPETITLVPDIGASWDAISIATDVRQIEAAGFARIGTFTFPELKGVVLWAFVNESEKAYSTITKIKGQVFDEFYGYLEEGGSLSASNSPQYGLLDARPGFHRNPCPGANAEITWLTWKQVAGDHSFLPASELDWAATFKRSYEEDVVWRKNKGMSAEEIRRIAERKGTELTEHKADEVAQQWTERQRN